MQMSFTFINDIENCKKWVSPDTIARFATFFDVPISTFFITENENKENIISTVFINTLCEEVIKTVKNIKERFKEK